MSFRPALLAVMLALTVVPIDIARAVPPVTNVEELSSRLEELRRIVRIPAFSAAIARDDRIVWAEGFGLADVEANSPATPQTCYHLASLTKTFASTIILQLVEAGRLDLEAPVSKFGITLDNDRDGAIRVKHLLTHTSEGTPGDNFSYNGNRFAQLDKVIAGAASSTFGELLCQRIIKPLGLTHTAPNYQDTANFPLAGIDQVTFERWVAKPYALSKTLQPERIEYPPHFSCSAGLISNVADVARYSIALDGGKLLTPASLDRAFTATTSNDGRTLPYGLGWFVLDLEGTKVVWHYGLWTGNSSMIVKVPSQRLTFVMLANSNRLSELYQLGKGKLLTSPFARAFLEGFVSGDGELPSEQFAE